MGNSDNQCPDKQGSTVVTVNYKVKQEKSFAAHWISFKCRENFRGSHFIYIERKPLLKKIQWENFRILLKIQENRKTFLPLNFCCLRYYYNNNYCYLVYV